MPSMRLPHGDHGLDTRRHREEASADTKPKSHITDSTANIILSRLHDLVAETPNLDVSFNSRDYTFHKVRKALATLVVRTGRFRRSSVISHLAPSHKRKAPKQCSPPDCVAFSKVSVLRGESHSSSDLLCRFSLALILAGGLSVSIK